MPMPQGFFEAAGADFVAGDVTSLCMASSPPVRRGARDLVGSGALDSTQTLVWFPPDGEPHPPLPLRPGQPRPDQLRQHERATCAGQLYEIPLSGVYHLTPRLDTYAGVMHTQVQGGLGNGYLHTTSADPTVGMRFRF
jgi:hypothetical protein